VAGAHQSNAELSLLDERFIPLPISGKPKEKYMNSIGEALSIYGIKLRIFFS
jgi:hypothetical protein